MKRIIEVDENLICEGFVRNFTEEEKDVLISAVRNSTPLPNITDEQISDAFQIAIANYWEEKSKYLTPPPTPAQCHNCPNEKSGVFMARPVEVVEMGEPLSNSDEISKALEKGELYKRRYSEFVVDLENFLNQYDMNIDSILGCYNPLSLDIRIEERSKEK